ncbi:MAG: ATP-binding protein [Polyangiaceae bacterium]
MKSADLGDERRQYLEETWAADARHDLVFASIALVALPLGWITDLAVLGTSTLSFALLALRVAHGLAALPLCLSSRAPKRPARHEQMRQLFVFALPAFAIAEFTLKPTSIGIQGWTMVALWLFAGLGVRADFSRKLALLSITFVAYAAHVAVVSSRLGVAYGKPNEIFGVLLVGAAAVLGSPWIPRRNEEARFQERMLRQELEREMALRAEREQALEAAKAKAEDEKNQRTKLLADLSHDLRTPLAGVLGLIELLGESDLNEEQRSQIATIRASNETLLALLNDILDFSRIDADRVAIVPVDVELAATLRAPADLLRTSASKKGLELDVSIDPALPKRAVLDPTRVHRVLLNLLGNAIKFTERGAVRMRAELRGEEGQWLRVEVTDSGIGFTDAQRRSLFQRFSQADASIAPRFGGTGLGLAIARGLVVSMGGTIDAETPPMGGACFWFQIPLVKSGAARASEAPVAPLRVLLAEDNAVNRMVLRAMITKLGHDLTVATDGSEALSRATNERFDLCILDMEMPGMDGDEVVRRLRDEERPPLRRRLVGLTAAATQEARDRFLGAGADAVYTKPLDLQRLKQLLSVEGERGRRNCRPHPAPLA